MSELFEYKCPNCVGPLRFDSTVQQLKCPYCDSTIDVAALAGYDEELKRSGADDMRWEKAAGGELLRCLANRRGRILLSAQEVSSEHDDQAGQNTYVEG